MTLAFLGSFALTLSIVGPATVLVFSLLGWAMRRYNYPVACTVVDVLLGEMVEGEALRTWQLGGGDPAWLLERPITLTLGAVLVLSLAWPALRKRRRAARPQNRDPLTPGR
jgi:putative tricarboxylic transport membrane protein